MMNIWIKGFVKNGEVDFVNKVILDETFVNNVKLKCVYDKLTADNNSLFRDTVGAFIDDPDFTLTFKVGNCATTNDQCTDDSDPYNIVVTFEDVSGNPIEIAQAILHEAIHAEIARFVKQFESGVDVNDRPRLFQMYAFYKGYSEAINNPNYNWSGNADHELMIEQYIKPIARALRQVDNYRYPLDNYMSYAWDGLNKYNYSNQYLTEELKAYYLNLRIEETNINIQFCN